MHDPMVVLFEIRRPPELRHIIQAIRRRRDPKAFARGRNDPRWGFSCYAKPGNHPSHKWWKPGSWSWAFLNLAGRRFYCPAIITVWHVEPGGRDAGEVCKRRRPIYKHLRHLSIQVHFLQKLRRRLLSRCAECKRSFRYGEAPTSFSWGGQPHKWWQGEPGIYHSHCASLVHLRRERETATKVVQALSRKYAISPELAMMLQRRGHTDAAPLLEFHEAYWLQRRIEELPEWQTLKALGGS